MEVLEGTELASAVMAQFEAPGRLRCAVAFWGPALAAIARKRGAEVLLDISMGGTTRNALRAFGLRRKRLPDPASSVRLLDGLHAKIFLGEEYAIVGSANASLNALGEPGVAPRLREAGVKIERIADPAGYKRVEKIWAKYHRLSRPIGPDDFDRAVRATANAAARDRGKLSATKPTSILTTLLENPEPFARTVFIFGDDDISPPELKEAKRGFRKDQGKTPEDAGRDHICTIEDDPPIDALLRSGMQVIMLWSGRGPGLHAYDDVVRIEHDGKVSYFGRPGWQRVRRALGLSGPGQTAAWRNDRALAAEVGASDGEKQGKRFVVLTVDRLIERLERMG